MKTIETKVYSFHELNEKAKEKAREWFREGNYEDNSFAEFVIEDAATQGAAMGIKIDKEKRTKHAKPMVLWSGFSSQGDGACFEGSWRAVDVKPGLVKDNCPQDEELHRIAAEFERIALAYPQASFTVKQSGRYYHKHSTDFDVHLTEDDDTEIDGKAFIDAENDLLEAARDFMQWIYRTLEKEWDWQNADEQVDENITANDYTFTENGNRFG